MKRLLKYGSTSYTPSKVPDLLVWLDFADASTVTTVSGKISQVLDKSGNNHHASQSVDANRPTYTNTLNGNRCYTGVATNNTAAQQALFNDTFPASARGNDMTIITVQNRTAANTSSWQQVWYSSSSTANTSSGAPHLAKRNNTSQFGFHNAWTADAGVFIEQSPNEIDFAWITAFRRSGGAPLGNGSQVEITGHCAGMKRAVFAQNFNSMINSAAGYAVGLQGGYSGVVYSFGGNIGEILVWPYALPDTQFLGIKKYLSRKWKIPL
jgi:hypothetical protein